MKKTITLFSIMALIISSFGYASACGHNGKDSQASTSGSACSGACKAMKAETANGASEKSSAIVQTADIKIVDNGKVAQKATCPYLSSMSNYRDANTAGVSGNNCCAGEVKSLQGKSLIKKAADKSKIASNTNSTEVKIIAQDMAN
jgi:hypothetical protein